MKNNSIKLSQSQPMWVHAAAITFMLLISYFAYPFAFQKLGCDAALGLVNCLIEQPEIYILLFALPTVYIAVIFVGLIVAKRDPQKAAQQANRPRTNRTYYLLAIFYSLMSILMFFSVYLSKDFMRANQDNFQLGISIATILFIFYIANLAPKMNRSLFSGWACRWNLKSDLAWEKSQRFAGFTLTIVCVISLIVAFTFVNWAIAALATGIAITYLGVCLVSYYVYKTEMALNPKEKE